jgi:class 3 adenylate cyclase
MESLTAGPIDAANTDAEAGICDRVLRYLEQGAPWDACDAFRAAVIAHSTDPELLYCGALAHARAGAAQEAHALLDRAQSVSSASPQLLADILSLRGRLWKDVLHRRPDAPDASAFAEQARGEYVAAWSLAHDPYPGINAAALALLMGDRAAAHGLAQEVGARLAAQGEPHTVWDHATAGEVALLLGRTDEARRHYAAAHALAGSDIGSVAAMRRQLLLLSRALPDAAAMLEVVRAADVVAFTGHMVDAPDRAVPRFPAGLVPAVETAVRQWIAALHQPIFYGSAACGADLIVAESALAAGAEVNIVLPFDREDFARTSVALGGAGWLARFDAALARATRIIPAIEERHLGDDVLFEHAARLVEGLAVLRAAQLQASPRLLCVIDAAADGGVGGTLSALERWTRSIGPPEVIDLAKLRNAAPPDRKAERVGGAIGRPHDAPREPAPSNASARPERTLKTLVFADFAGYGRLRDVNAARFQSEFWDISARQIERSAVKPLFANTWGDGLFLVFEASGDGAAFATGLAEATRAVDWAALGMPDTSHIRICLHTGPVFRAFDPVIARDNYFGSTVTRAARIEPITPPDAVYASEAFAATLAATGQDDFVLEYVGRVGLAKGSGESRVYRLERR